jgi:hypothetical protein
MIPHSFELNREIQRWRENLAQSPAIRLENLDELESHLRDSVTALQTSGLSTGEAFMVATKRIGKGDLLETEFRKVNGRTVWLDRMLWMLIGIQVWGFVSGLVGAISSGAVSLGLVGGNFDFNTHGRTLPVLLFAGVRLLAVVGSLAICWWLIVRKGQSLGSRINWFVDGRMKLAMICGAFCVVSLAGSALGYSSPILLLKLTDSRTYGEVMLSQSYSYPFGWMIQAGGLIILTLLLARKRLRLNRA